jgi:hypothetical protein
MTAHDQPSRVESLLQQCSTSASFENAQTEMERFFQVTIWVESLDFADFRRMRFFAERQVGHNRLGSVIEDASWGPFEGSWYGAFFGRMNRKMTGEEFQWGLWQVVNDFENKFGGAIEAGTRAILIVGTVAIGMTGSPEGAQGRTRPEPDFSRDYPAPSSARTP